MLYEHVVLGEPLTSQYSPSVRKGLFFFSFFRDVESRLRDLVWCLDYMQESTGFRSDVETLLSNFIDTDSVRFEDFARIYKEMNFSLVFFLLDDEELPAFLDSAYSITRSFLQSKFQFQVRVGALYLLYALYSQQPFHGTDRIKIKFTPEMWTEFVDLIVEVKEQEHHDTNFIFYQLYASKAFYLVAHAEMVVMNREQNKINTSASNQLRESISLDNYLDPNLLRGLEEVHRKYEAAKAELSGTLTGNESVLITNQLHMSNSNLLSDVAAQFTQFSEIIEKMQNESAEGANAENASASTEQKVSDQKAVKLKAMSSNVAAPRHFKSVIKDEPYSPMRGQIPEETQELQIEKEDSADSADDSYANNELFADLKQRPVRSANHKQKPRVIMSSKISANDFYEGAISLQSSASTELPYIKTQPKTTNDKK